MSDGWWPNWGSRTFLMAVLNVTPDSFSGDGIYRFPERAVQRGRTLAAARADVIDIGGESTRPGYTPVSEAEETARVIPVIRALRQDVALPLSVDTSKASVAQAALAAGASIVNDVSGLGDPEMAGVVARASAGLVLVDNLRRSSRVDLVRDVARNLEASAHRAVKAGIRPDRIILDPGLGFGKSWRENFEIMRRLPELREIGRPLLLGPSRKGMIGRALGVAPDDRIEGSIALSCLCVAGGADALRVHDLPAVHRAVGMMDTIVRGREAG